MQSYAQIVDPELSIEQLYFLAANLTKLPKGWAYTTQKLASPVNVTQVLPRRACHDRPCSSMHPLPPLPNQRGSAPMMTRILPAAPGWLRDRPPR